ncbi:MAG: class I SAM-dependent RNA methyltransferase [Spirochaetaceae bacterium]|jgi:putative N6-adenine-specific DNA methylase|nr:class I SAM-dependent RNA methyltransferase [Spirochaetaceae bacterium]
MWTAIALCAAGAERLTSNELKKNGLRVVDSGYGRVRFEADTAGLYRALMALRTADRLLLEAARFEAADFDALFEGCRAVPWEDLIPPGRGLVVAKVRANRSRLQALTSIQAVVHKAAASRLCEVRHLSRLPDEEPAELRLYLEKDQASLLLDLSGEPLFKRGYRPAGGVAPLRETTAAALLLLAGWKRKFPLYDPFCGSGTILIEALLYAWDLAPGLGRPFALSSLAIGDRKLEGALREELRARANFENRIRIYGSDADAAALALARANLTRAAELAAGRGGDPANRPARMPPAMPPPGAGVEVRRLPAEEARAPEAEGFIITNPPYGRRLGDAAEAEARYRELGALGERFPGWKLGLITDHEGFESHFGKKADSVKELISGAVHSYFYEYHELS